MKYTKEERLKIGKQIHEARLSDRNASKLFGICEESARRYRILYEQTAGIEHIHLKNGTPSEPAMPPSVRNRKKGSSTAADTASDYESMTKEELIRELMEAKIREARLKKGYEVKGVGADREYILLDSKNTK